MSKNKLFVGNLDYSVDSQTLFDYLSSKWDVTECRVIDGKGFGFVTFASEESCLQAKEALHDSEFKGRTMKVDFAKDRPKSAPGAKSGGGPRKNFSGNRRRFD